MNYRVIFAVFAGWIFVCAAQDHLDGIAAVVDGEVITFSQVKAELNRLRKANPGGFSTQERELGRMGILRKITQQLIEDRLVMAEVKDRGIQLPKDYVERRIQSLVDSRFAGDWQKLTEALTDAGQSLKEYRDEMGKRFAAELLVDELVRRDVSVNAADILDYYERHPEDFRVPERVRLSLIFLARKPGEDDASLAARLESLQQQLGRGELFEELAKQVSDDSTADLGGDLGWVQVEKLSDLYRGAIAGVQAGQLAEVIREPGGFHLLKMTDRETAHKVELDASVRKGIENLLKSRRTQTRYEAFIADLREKFYVKNYVESNLPDEAE